MDLWNIFLAFWKWKYPMIKNSWDGSFLASLNSLSHFSQWWLTSLLNLEVVWLFFKNLTQFIIYFFHSGKYKAATKILEQKIEQVLSCLTKLIDNNPQHTVSLAGCLNDYGYVSLFPLPQDSYNHPFSKLIKSKNCLLMDIKWELTSKSP